MRRGRGGWISVFGVEFGEGEVESFDLRGMGMAVRGVYFFCGRAGRGGEFFRFRGLFC